MVRFKNRYFVFELTWKDGGFDETLNEAALLAVFRESIQRTFGDYGLGSALASFQVKYYNPVSNICMIRCSRDEYRHIWCALTLITEIKNRVVRVQMLHLTGTAKKCIELAQAREKTVLKGMKLGKQQQALVEAASKRLQAVES